MVVHFEKEIKTDFNCSKVFNKTIIDIWVIPYENWHLKIENYDIKNLNLTWNCTDFKNKTLKMKIEFFKPEEISPNIMQDKIFINFTKAVKLGYFESTNNQSLRKQDHQMTSNLKK